MAQDAVCLGCCLCTPEVAPSTSSLCPFCSCSLSFFGCRTSLCFLSSCKIYDVTFSCSATLFHEALGLCTKSRVVGRAGLCAFCLLFTPYFLRHTILLFFLILLLLLCPRLCLPWCSLCIEMLRDKSVISPRRSWLI